MCAPIFWIEKKLIPYIPGELRVLAENENSGTPIGGERENRGEYLGKIDNYIPMVKLGISWRYLTLPYHWCAGMRFSQGGFLGQKWRKTGRFALKNTKMHDFWRFLPGKVTVTCLLFILSARRIWAWGWLRWAVQEWKIIEFWLKTTLKGVEMHNNNKTNFNIRKG